MSVTTVPDPRTHLLEVLRIADTPEGGVAGAQRPWDAMLAIAPPDIHPYLGWRADTRAETLPAHVRARFAATRRAAHMGALARRAAIATIAGACAERAIPILALKGAALAHLVYPDPALRPMQDLDFWARETDLEAIARALAPAGYRIPARAPTSGPELELHLELEASRILVELHARPPSMRGAGGVTFDTVWSQRVWVSVAGVDVAVPRPVDLLTHVALHAARMHAFSAGLRPLLDLALLVDPERDAWDWDGLVSDWRRDRTASWILLALALARDLLGARIPADLERRAGLPPRWEEMRALALEQIWEGPGRQFPTALRMLSSGRSVKQRLRYLHTRGIRFYFHNESDAPRSMAARLRTALARVAFDIRVKIPTYLARWRRGELGSRERWRLAERRGRLEQLVEASDALPVVEPIQGVETRR